MAFISWVIGTLQLTNVVLFYQYIFVFRSFSAFCFRLFLKEQRRRWSIHPYISLNPKAKKSHSAFREEGLAVLHHAYHSVQRHPSICLRGLTNRGGPSQSLWIVTFSRRLRIPSVSAFPTPMCAQCGTAARRRCEPCLGAALSVQRCHCLPLTADTSPLLPIGSTGGSRGPLFQTPPPRPLTYMCVPATQSAVCDPRGLLLFILLLLLLLLLAGQAGAQGYPAFHIQEFFSFFMADLGHFFFRHCRRQHYFSCVWTNMCTSFGKEDIDFMLAINHRKTCYSIQ